MFGKLGVYLKVHRKFLTVSAGVFFFLAFLAVSPIFVEAMLTLSAQRNAQIQQKNNAIEAAISGNDYATWSSLVNDNNLKAKVNAGNFSQFTNAYNLLEQGKMAEADLIKKQLSLKQDFAAAAAKSDEIRTAISNDDYDAWRVAVGSGVEPQVDTSNFHQYTHSYWLIMSGNISGANRIKRKIGVKPVVGGVNYSSSR